MTYPNFPVVCACRRRYPTIEDFRKLEFCGYQEVAADPTDLNRPEAYRLELRHCACASTLGIDIEATPKE